VAIRHLRRPEIQRFLRRADVSGLKQRMRVAPQRLGAAPGGVGAGEPRGGVGILAGAPIQITGREGGVGALFQGERLLERPQRFRLPEHHLQGLTQQHEGVGVVRKAHAGFTRRIDGAPPILTRAGQMNEGDVGLAEGGREGAPEAQPGNGARGGVPLTGGGAAHAEACERGAQGAEHCLIMGAAAVRLQRRMSRALEGRRIVITRAREQAADLARALEAHGAAVVLAPVIRIEPLPQLAPLRAALAGLSAYRWVVFTSQNAVHIVFDRLLAWGLGPRTFASTSVAAIGSATGDALTQRGVVPALVPDEFVGEALAEALGARGGLAGSRVLVPSAQDARDALAAGLRAHGAVVEVVPVYRTVPATIDLSDLAVELQGGRVDAVTFTSSSTVRCFVELVGRNAATSGRFTAAVIGPVTAGTARDLGLGDVLEAEPHTVAGLVDALLRRFA